MRSGRLWSVSEPGRHSASDIPQRHDDVSEQGIGHLREWLLAVHLLDEHQLHRGHASALCERNVQGERIVDEHRVVLLHSYASTYPFIGLWD